jgi:hypothetical protein
VRSHFCRRGVAPANLTILTEGVLPRYTIDRFEGTAWAVLEDEDAKGAEINRCQPIWRSAGI